MRRQPAWIARCRAWPGATPPIWSDRCRRSDRARSRPPSWTRSPRDSPTPRSRRSPPGMRSSSEGLGMTAMTRRDMLASAGTAAVAAMASPRPSLAQTAARHVVVIGGGCAGATTARALKRLDGGIAVTLVEASPTVFTACPFSNGVIAGLRDISAQQFSYEKILGDGVVVTRGTANLVDPQARSVIVGNGVRLRYDRLVLAPGRALHWGALPGYGEDAVTDMTH